MFVITKKEIKIIEKAIQDYENQYYEEKKKGDKQQEDQNLTALLAIENLYNKLKEGK